MTARRSHRLPLDVGLRAMGAGLLVLGLSFLLFGLGFYVEGLLDLSDGRMDGHDSLDLSEDVAIYRFWRRIGIALWAAGGLLASALTCFGIALAVRSKPADRS